jgi:5'-3' exonuclease
VSTTTLIDVNNLATRILFTGPIGAASDKPDYHMLKYIMVDSIYRTMLKTKASEIILAVDSQNVWRKDIFPRYKESRKFKRSKKINVDWNQFYMELEEFLENVKTYLPFKVLKVDRAEADDIVGVFTLHYTQKDIVIVSTDEDFKQLISSRVKMWQPIKYKWVECANPKAFLILKCIVGQPKDDIFNVLTPEDWPAEKRKPSISEEKIWQIMKSGKISDWLVYEGAIKRFDVNRKLIDFRCTPTYIVEQVVKQYESYRMPNLDDAYKFFTHYGFKSYVDDYHRVENSLIRLYS